MSYAIHGRPPEGDCKPPQAADFALYRAATYVSASSRVSNTWASITGDVGRDYMGKTSRKFPAAWPRRGRRHGLADPIITPQNTLDYCCAVEKAAGDSVADHFHFFMIPGMDLRASSSSFKSRTEPSSA